VSPSAAAQVGPFTVFAPTNHAFAWIVGGVHYVNVHLSPDLMGASVACGDVVLH